MTMKFLLLHQLAELAQKKRDIPLEELKNFTKQYIDAHNSIMEEIWNLNVILAEGTINEKKTASNKLKELQSILGRSSSEQGINRLLTRIKTMEKELQGTSEVFSHTPCLI